MTAVPGEFVDVHCHCLPGVDDGPANLEQSLALCEALVADGFSRVVATPHQLGRYEGLNTREVVLSAAEELTTALDSTGIPLRVHLGADVRIDDRLIERVAAGDAFTIGDQGQYLLLELPHSNYIDPVHAYRRLADRGIRTVMTHPERYRYLGGAIEPVEAWRSEGVAIQVTAGSLLGDFGRSAFSYGWRLVHAGLVDLIATDAHDTTRRRPRMKDALERLVFEVGEAEAYRLCYENPWRVFEGQPVLDREERS